MLTQEAEEHSNQKQQSCYHQSGRTVVVLVVLYDVAVPTNCLCIDDVDGKVLRHVSQGVENKVPSLVRELGHIT